MEKLAHILLEVLSGARLHIYVHSQLPYGRLLTMGYSRSNDDREIRFDDSMILQHPIGKIASRSRSRSSKYCPIRRCANDVRFSPTAIMMIGLLYQKKCVHI